MIDLHCHILPGIDDGAADADVAIAMARAFVADGVRVVACTPHILPGLFPNSGSEIRGAVAQLQQTLDHRDIPLRLVCGADNHIVADFVEGLRSGHLLTLADTRYVLVEPPHHVAPPRMEDFFFGLQVAGYVPILTHPERLSWIKSHYDTIVRLVQGGMWVQLTAGSLTGAFGRSAQYWSHRLLDEGHVHVLATDAHDMRRRPPDLARGRDHAAQRIGEAAANDLVVTLPLGVLNNRAPNELPMPTRAPMAPKGADGGTGGTGGAHVPRKSSRHSDGARVFGFSERLRRLFE